MVIKVISGGQTGIDRMGLEVARDLGFPTGGSAPKNFMTELGPDPSLADFGLVALQQREYPMRTRKNVVDSDGTVIYGDLTGGTGLTAAFCVEEVRPYLVNPGPAELAAFVQGKEIRVLNVAGNRWTKLSMQQLAGYQEQFRESLILIASWQPS
jgi:Circularly permutated YpsA SLOG family